MKNVFIILALIVVTIGYQAAWAVSEKEHNKTAIELADKWQNLRIQPFLGPDGKILYPYGATAVTIISKPFHHTEVVFEPGEYILKMAAGDTARWFFDADYQGEGENKVLHFFIRPTYEGLKTSLTILTTKRSYRFRLESRNEDQEYMEIVGFSYPKNFNQILKKSKQLITKQKAKDKRETFKYPDVHTGKIKITDLDFNYSMDGDDPLWKPVRVYYDGAKTIIELPEEARNSEVPILTVLGPDKKKALVTQRLKDNRFIVDKKIKRALLISGVGDNEESVIIKYVGKK